MSALRLLIAGEWRRQRRNLPWLMLVVVLGAGAAMFTLAASRRAESSYDRFRAATDDGDVFVGVPDAPDQLAELLALPQVDRAAPFGYVPIWHADAPQVDRENGGAYLSVDGRWLYDNLRPYVVEGRMPDRNAGSSMSVNEAFADAHDVDVGDTVAMEAAVGESLVPIEMRVDAITRTSLDLASNAGGQVAYLPPGFTAVHPEVEVARGFAMVWLEGRGSAAASYADSARHVAGDGSGFFSGDMGKEAQIVESATSVIATAFALIAAALAVASLLVAGLLAARSASSERSRLLPLRAAGATRWQRALAAAAPPLVTAVAALLLAALVAFALSPIRAGGLARDAEPEPGAFIDGATDSVVALTFVVIVGAGALLATVFQRVAVRSAPTRRQAPWRRVGQMVAPALGARFASRLGAAAFVGTVVGLAGVVGAMSFAGRFSRVVDDPGLWGAPFDFTVNLDDAEDTATEHVRGLEGVSGVTVVRYADLIAVGSPSPDSQTETFDATLMGFGDLTGPAPVKILEGRLPAGADEAALGPDTAGRVGATVGDVIAVPAVGGGTTLLTVVGRVLVPVVADGSRTTGVVVGAETFDVVAHSEEIDPVLWVTVAGRDDVPAVVRDVEELGLSTGSPERPSELHNLAPVRSHPLVLGGVLGGLGLTAVAGGVAAATRRRRREVAALRALGLTSAQLRSACAWETAWISVGALLLGAPLGVLVANQAWNQFADGLFLPSGLDSPWVTAAATSLGVAVAALVSTAWPAHRSSRRSIGRDLREP